MKTTHTSGAAPARKPRRPRSIPLLKRRQHRYRGRRPVLPDAIALEAVALLDQLAARAEAIADGQGQVFLLVTLPTAVFDRLCQYGGAVEDLEDNADAEPSVGADQPELDTSDEEPSLVGNTPGASGPYGDGLDGEQGYGPSRETVEAARARSRRGRTPPSFEMTDPAGRRVRWQPIRRGGGQ